MYDWIVHARRFGRRATDERVTIGRSIDVSCSRRAETRPLRVRCGVTPSDRLAVTVRGGRRQAAGVLLCGGSACTVAVGRRLGGHYLELQLN